MSKNNVLEIKKLFTKYSDVNFFNEFTLQDVEEAKKKSFFALSMEQPHNVESIKIYLENGAKELMENKFMNGQESKSVGVLVKNTVRDTLNPNYKNTIKRLICIDSQYRPNIYNYNDPDTNECDFTVALSEKLINVVNIQIENIQIPFTFFNIEKFDTNQAFIAAKLDEFTKKYSLSFEDRACLALAKANNLTVLTADKTWKEMEGELGIDIRLVVVDAI